MDPQPRRQFLQTTSTLATGLLSGSISLRAAAGPNDRLTLGLIGVGGRGSYLMGEILPRAEKLNVRIGMVCDVWRRATANAAATIQQKLGDTPRQCTRFQEVLDNPDIDAVVIATPDSSHGRILVAALSAGKDVYIEKPMTIDLDSANRALELAERKQLVVQAGTQRRSEGQFIAAASRVANGELGTLSRISAAMNVNQARWHRATIDCKPDEVDWAAFQEHLPRRVPFDPHLLAEWQLYRATSNGMPGLWMTHYADAVHMITGAAYPSSAVAHGGIYVWKDGRQHADTFHALVEYPEGFLFSWSMGLGNSAGIHFTMHGTQATLDLEKWQLLPEPSPGQRPAPINVQAAPSVNHVENWLECLRSRRPTNAPIRCGHQHAVATILCATAIDQGRRMRYDAKRQRIEAA